MKETLTEQRLCELAGVKESGPQDKTTKTAPVKDDFTESRRLFKLFFGDWTPDALAQEMKHDNEFELVVRALYGWALPDYKRPHDRPNPGAIKIAQEFEAEGKDIEYNEKEFLERLDDEEHDEEEYKQRRDGTFASSVALAKSRGGRLDLDQYREIPLGHNRHALRHRASKGWADAVRKLSNN